MNEQTAISEIAKPVAERASSVFGSIKDFFKPEMIMAKFHEWKGSLLDWGIYLGVGFFVGFLVKRYLKYILLLLLFVVALVLLEQFNILHIQANWAKMQELFNIHSTSRPFDAQTINAYIDWVKANFAFVLTASIGFFLGLKVG